MNDFTGSEAILGPRLETTDRMTPRLTPKWAIPHVVKKAQGFAERVSAGLSGPACLAVGGGVF